MTKVPTNFSKIKGFVETKMQYQWEEKMPFVNIEIKLLSR